MICTQCLKDGPSLDLLPHAMKAAWTDVARRWRLLLASLGQLG